MRLSLSKSSALVAFAVGAVALLASACGDNKTHPEHSAYDAGPSPPLSCVPNLDGRVDSKELAAVLGVPVKYLVSPSGKERTIDVAGGVDPASGKLTWNYGVDLADDQILTITASSLSDKWYATSFTNAQFVAPFDAAQTLDAIYTQDDKGLYLLGLASKSPTPPEGKTLLVYGSPVQVFAFPMTAGASWTSTATITNGTLRGQPYAGKDTYDVKDDATGQLVLPDLTFTQVHRVRTRVTTVPSAGQSQTTLQVSFIFECFGEVARATSKANETNENFTTAAEVRRFGF